MGSAITFHAVVGKIQTVRKGDGAFRITMDIPLCDKKQIAKLMEMDTEQITFAVAMVIDRDRQIVKGDADETEQAHVAESSNGVPSG